VERTAQWYRLRHESHADRATLLRFSLDEITSYTVSARQEVPQASHPVMPF